MAIDGGPSVDSLMDVGVSERSFQNKYKPLKLSNFKEPKASNLANQLKNVNVQIKVDSTLTPDQSGDILLKNSKSHQNIHDATPKIIKHDLMNVQNNPSPLKGPSSNVRLVNDTPFSSEKPHEFNQGHMNLQVNPYADNQID